MEITSMASCTVTYSNDDWSYQEYSINFEARATSIHEPMVKYYRDGTGYPGYDGIEDIEYTINSVVDAEGNELELNAENYPAHWTEEQVKALDAALNNFLENVEWDYPEDPRDGWDEPPED